MKNKLITVLSFTALGFFFTACSSKPVIPKSKDIEVSREKPSDKCRKIGTVEGRPLNYKGTHEEALEDMKKEAAAKGANYVQIEVMGTLVNSVRGTGYFCD